MMRQRLHAVKSTGGWHQVSELSRGHARGSVRGSRCKSDVRMFEEKGEKERSSSDSDDVEQDGDNVAILEKGQEPSEEEDFCR